jgi:hypothetical protein
VNQPPDQKKKNKRNHRSARSRRHDGRRGGRRGASPRLHPNRKKGSTRRQRRIAPTKSCRRGGIPRRQRQIAQTKSCRRGGIPRRVWEERKGGPACRCLGRANPRSVSSDRWCLCSIGVWRGSGSAGAGWRERAPLNPVPGRFPYAAESDFQGGKFMVMPVYL